MPLRDPMDPMPPLIRGGLLAMCPVCFRWLPAGFLAWVAYSLHYGTAHLNLSPWRLF